MSWPQRQVTKDNSVGFLGYRSSFIAAWRRFCPLWSCTIGNAPKISQHVFSGVHGRTHAAYLLGTLYQYWTNTALAPHDKDYIRCWKRFFSLCSALCDVRFCRCVMGDFRLPFCHIPKVFCWRPLRSSNKRSPLQFQLIHLKVLVLSYCSLSVHQVWTLIWSHEYIYILDVSVCGIAAHSYFFNCTVLYKLNRLLCVKQKNPKISANA